MRQDILTKKLILGFTHRIANIPFLFTHAGFHNNFIKYLQFVIGSFSSDDIVSYMNGILIDKTASCASESCAYADEIFEAGKDRGGTGIGGPL